MRSASGRHEETSSGRHEFTMGHLMSLEVNDVDDFCELSRDMQARQGKVRRGGGGEASRFDVHSTTGGVGGVEGL